MILYDIAMQTTLRTIQEARTISLILERQGFDLDEMDEYLEANRYREAMYSLLQGFDRERLRMVASLQKLLKQNGYDLKCLSEWMDGVPERQKEYLRHSTGRANGRVGQKRVRKLPLKEMRELWEKEGVRFGRKKP